MKRMIYLFSSLFLLMAGMSACSSTMDEPEQPTTRQDEVPVVEDESSDLVSGVKVDFYLVDSAGNVCDEFKEREDIVGILRFENTTDHLIVFSEKWNYFLMGLDFYVYSSDGICHGGTFHSSLGILGLISMLPHEVMTHSTSSWYFANFLSYYDDPDLQERDPIFSKEALERIYLHPGEYKAVMTVKDLPKQKKPINLTYSFRVTERKLDQSANRVENRVGVIHYDSDQERWFIQESVSDAIDSVNRYYPSQLKDEFQKEGLEVGFSGQISPSAIQAQVGGLKIYDIVLTHIGAKQ